MADTGNAGTGQEPGQQGQQTGQEPAATDQSQGQQQQGTGQAPGQQQQGQQGTEDGLPDLSGITDPALRAWVVQQARDAKDARAEAARFRTEFRSAQDQVTQYQRQNETAEQKAEREAQEHQAALEALRTENRNLKLGSQWTAAASAAKALDATALLNLLGGPDKIDLDDDGKATNLEALLTEARAQYPWAFSRTAGADGHEGGGSEQAPTAGSMNDWIRGRR